MKKLFRSLTHHDALFLLLLFVVGAAILMAVLFAAYAQGVTDDASLIQLEMRNRLLQLEVRALIDAQHSRIAVAAESVPSDVLDPTEALVNAARIAYSGIDQRPLYVVAKDRSVAWSVIDGSTVTVSGMPEIPPRSTVRGDDVYGRLAACTTDGGMTADLCLIFSVASELVVIPADLARASEALSAIVPVEAEAVLIDNFGIEITRIDANTSADGGYRILACEQPTAEMVDRLPPSSLAGLVLCDQAERRPYLGVLNQFLGRVDRPVMVRVDNSVHSLIPVNSLGIYLALVEPMPSIALWRDNSLVAISLIGLVLYVTITWLFMSFRRTVANQTQNLSDLSAQKDVLFSLLSHNLKNNLAAISAHAHSDGTSDELRRRLQLSVDEASRVISDSLYFLQIREKRFDTPSCERIDAREIAEFLSLRCQLSADAAGIALGTSFPPNPVPVFTNLNLALEALERLVLAALEATPDSVTISVESETSAIVLSLGESGLSDHQLHLLDGGTPIADYEPTRGQDMSVISLSVCQELLASIGSGIDEREGELSARSLVIRFPAL